MQLLHMLLLLYVLIHNLEGETVGCNDNVISLLFLLTLSD